MEKNWVKIFETPEDLNMEIARQQLEDHGIEAVVINKKDRTYLIGELELYVNRDRVIEAKSVIKELLD